ncbi:hypothetical protein ACFE04_014252 [Oxalis oulophora]
MGFFDLNIPYNETSSSSTSSSNHKTTRIKIATKTMELGYSGIAYNRTIKGVMSDHDRCSISLLSLSTLQKLVPSLSSAVNFHRDLLNIPRSSPFRQYTRLTACADTVAQAQVLNSANSVIKTYDLVAVRPLNQNAFDYACEKSEVDIVSIDFSSKLPFRLKMSMVKAAIERGVYFEIVYADLVGDIQVRRQMIANAKLLVDWTRGRNLILSSAAPSVNELRGPYDAANLLSLIGVSMEHAKAAISKNCRTLIANALRKKHFTKEAIRVEAIPSFFSKEPSSANLLKWDPISSGDGDLLLEDMAKSFAATNELSNNTVKAINFASITETHGFQVKDLLPASKISSQSLKNGKTLLPAEVTRMPVQTSEVSKHNSKLAILHHTNQTLLNETNSRCHTKCETSSKLCLPNSNTNANPVEKMNISRPEVSFKEIEAEIEGMQLRKCISSDQDAELSMKNVMVIETEIEGVQLQKGISIDQDAELSMKNVDSDSLIQDMELDGVINDITVTEKNSTPHITSTVKELKNTTNSVEHPSSKLDNTGGLPTLFADIIDSNSLNEESKIMRKSDVILVEQNEMLIDVEVEADKIDLEEANRDMVFNGVISYGNSSGGEKSEEASNDRDAVEVKDFPSIADHEPLSKVSMEETRDECMIYSESLPPTSDALLALMIQWLKFLRIALV